MGAALFVDVNNIFYSTSKKFTGRKVDYKKYLMEANKISSIGRALAYGFQMNDEAINFITCLRKIGFDTKYKKPRLIGSGEDDSKKFKKMDWNVGICMDVVRLIDRVDTIIIGSSDPELVPLLSWIHDRGVQTVIFSSIISRELKEVVDRYQEITEDCLEDLEER